MTPKKPFWRKGQKTFWCYIVLLFSFWHPRTTLKLCFKLNESLKWKGNSQQILSLRQTYVRWDFWYYLIALWGHVKLFRTEQKCVVDHTFSLMNFDIARPYQDRSWSSWGPSTYYGIQTHQKALICNIFWNFATICVTISYITTS